jgi:hypothetical protein
MLKMTASGTRPDGRPLHLVVFGLSSVNIERLQARQPIRVSGADIGLPDVEVMIFAGDTEQSMAREIHSLIGPDTQTRIDPRFKD